MASLPVSLEINPTMVFCRLKYYIAFANEVFRSFQRDAKGTSKGMRLKIDKDSDALYFRLDENRIVESEEVRPGVILDYDTKGQVVGIEILNISSRATKEELSNLQFQMA